MSDIVERLRKHVTDRGGASIDNGAWQMMLDAADEIDDLRTALAGVNREWNEAKAEADENLSMGHVWRRRALTAEAAYNETKLSKELDMRKGDG